MQNENLESQFNMALAYLQRIDKILYLCQKSAMQSNINSWVIQLRALFREASVKLSEVEKNEILGNGYKIDYKTLLDNNIEESEANFKSIYCLINDPLYVNTKKNTILFLLDALEIKIRRKLQEKGMLLPSKKDPTKAILEH